MRLIAKPKTFMAEKPLLFHKLRKAILKEFLNIELFYPQ
jgi:hypothetical protein